MEPITFKEIAFSQITGLVLLLFQSTFTEREAQGLEHSFILINDLKKKKKNNDKT